MTNDQAPSAGHSWIEIRAYREFYDVPRMFIVVFKGAHVLFDSPFRDLPDEYSPDYDIYAMPPLTDAQLEGGWTSMPAIATCRIGSIPVCDVIFDPSQRRAIDAKPLERLMA